jgi:hypothetical protein
LDSLATKYVETRLCMADLLEAGYLLQLVVLELPSDGLIGKLEVGNQNPSAHLINLLL